jgi:hypothetical protein
LKTSKITSFSIFIFYFAFWRNCSIKRKDDSSIIPKEWEAPEPHLSHPWVLSIAKAWDEYHKPKHRYITRWQEWEAAKHR